MIIILLVSCNSIRLYAQQVSDIPTISFNQNTGLTYTKDSLGNRIPDFSYCGYKASEQPITNVTVRLVIPLLHGDATPTIQTAIDYLGTLPPDEDGFRGAILLKKGTYILNGRLKINSSGIIIRGSGMDEDGTVLLAAGHDRMTLIRIAGSDDRVPAEGYEISAGYAPVNSREFTIKGPHQIKEGDRIYIHRPSTEEWIGELSMEEFGGETSWLGWKPGERDLYWDRLVIRVEGNTITVDAPITIALDSAFGGGKVIPYKWPGRIRNIGIENLCLHSSYDTTNLKDEAHCWMAVTMENVEDAWIRQVKFAHFAGSAVALYETARRITVEDCISIAPVSEIGGQRRYTFFTMGQQCLFQRIWAEQGYHDFAAGFCAAGPNAFVQCESHLPYSFSGTIDSWVSGVLFDIVNIDGHALSYKNRGQDAMGAGWCAANSLFWQCSAAHIDCYKPPTANNWAFGSWAEFAGDGYWAESNNHIVPRSLYYGQLSERLGVPYDEYANELIPVPEGSTTSPTPELATELNMQSYTPAISFIDWIEEATERNPIPVIENHAEEFRLESVQDHASSCVSPSFKIQNGWLVQEGMILTGRRYKPPWWRGDARPYEAAVANPSITLFVPGRYGNGYTDKIEEVCEWLETNDVIALEHNYGLWYDRRRDDHERIRRMNGEVWAPFYEQPFARSGEGTAWDGLSKYDLEEYNEWYWRRLKDFADMAGSKGMMLVHHNYFQHNILEAGAHYADFPWRTINNVNHTGFPEPPFYAGDKRIFMDGQFYDINHPVRRELHRKYIRKCLDNFAENSNVVQLISAEYTGPLHFVQFWIDVILEWQAETGCDALVGLSTTKDVQDAILADPVRSGIIDIIDIRYWSYREDGSLFAPLSDQHLAPRQHARLINPGKRSFNQVYRAVREYKKKFPEKAVIYSESEYDQFGWAVFMAGGSLPVIPSNLPVELLSDAATMEPVELKDNPQNVWALANKDGDMIIYCNTEKAVQLDRAGYNDEYRIDWIDPETGTLVDSQSIHSGKTTEVKRPGDKPLVLWMHQ